MSHFGPNWDCSNFPPNPNLRPTSSVGNMLLRIFNITTAFKIENMSHRKAQHTSAIICQHLKAASNSSSTLDRDCVCVYMGFWWDVKPTSVFRFGLSNRNENWNLLKFRFGLPQSKPKYHLELKFGSGANSRDGPWSTNTWSPLKAAKIVHHISSNRSFCFYQIPVAISAASILEWWLWVGGFYLKN